MLSASVERITPGIAKEMLAMNTTNFRRVDFHRVDRYAKEIALGKWQLNGEAIKLNGTTLIDGQHRLHAVVRSGVAIDTLVVRGIETDGQTVDRGKPRTISQWCNSYGIKNANVVASIAKMCVVYNKKMWSKPTLQLDEVVDSEVYEFIFANNDGLQHAAHACAATKRFLPPSMFGAILFIGCGGKDPKTVDLAKWFCDSLVKGENLSDDDAVLHLRNKLVNQTPQMKLTPFMKKTLATMAWNKTVLGEPATATGLRLRMTGPAKMKAPNEILVIE